MDYWLSIIEDYGLYVIFFLIMIEYACFPIPSEVVLPLAGAVGYINDINPFVMIFLATLFGFIGSLFCYYLGYFGNNKLLNKLTKKKNKEIDESKSFYSKYSNLSICAGRIVPICRTYISFIAGAKKHRILEYTIFTLIGIFIWNAFLITLGYYFYDNIEVIQPFYQSYKTIILIILGAIISFMIIKKIIKRKKLAL